MSSLFFCFQAEDGIRDLVRSRGLGDVYKRQGRVDQTVNQRQQERRRLAAAGHGAGQHIAPFERCLLYTSDAADERSSVDLGGRRIIKKKNNGEYKRQAATRARRREVRGCVHDET